MFTIIGADHKEYGPVSAEDITQWIAEGRADGQTYAKAHPNGEWKALSAFTEFAAALAEAPKAATTSFSPSASGAPTQEEILARDYDIDIGSCLSRSWELVKQNFWPVVGITFLVAVLMSIINQGLGLISKSETEAVVTSLKDGHGLPGSGYGLIILTWILSIPVQSVFTAGLYIYYLKLIRGEPADLSDVFSGISRSFVPLVFLGLVMGLLVFLGCVLCVIPGIYISVAWCFAIALVVDKNMNFWEAMELSRKVVTRHWFTVFALILVVALVSCVGVCALCIGLLVTMPIAYIALMYAYEDIFGRRAP